MMLGWWTFFSILIGLMACDKPNKSVHEQTIEAEERVQENIHRKESVTEKKKALTAHKNGEFELFFHGVTIKARVDEKSNITILNWPKEWHLKSKIVRYIGADPKPFNKDFCRGVRALAEFPGGKEIVREAYFSELVFEVLPFFGDEFAAAVGKALEEFGHPKDDMYILNAIDRPNGRYEIDFSPNAISRVMDLLSLYWVRYSPQSISSFDEVGEQRITIWTGDFLCDLTSGDAVMYTVYPIDYDKNTIKVIYDPLELALNQQPRR